MWQAIVEFNSVGPCRLTFLRRIDYANSCYAMLVVVIQSQTICPALHAEAVKITGTRITDGHMAGELLVCHVSGYLSGYTVPGFKIQKVLDKNPVRILLRNASK